MQLCFNNFLICDFNREPDNDFGWSYTRQPSLFISDKNDIAAKDLIRQKQREKKRHLMMEEQERKSKEREDAASKQSLVRWKEQFGGGKKGERMAKTLQKLHLAYEKGLDMEKEKKKDDERSLTDSDGWSDSDIDRILERRKSKSRKISIEYRG